VFGNRVLRGMFGLKRNEVTGEWRKLHIEEGPCCYQAMSKLIIVKSTVGIISCLCALCNYTKV